MRLPVITTVRKKHSSMSLRDWPILRKLCPDFFTTIQMAFVFGSSGNEALLVASDNKVYGVGGNHCGCLGVGDTNSHPLPKEVINLSNKNIEGLACGGDFSNSGTFVVAYLYNGDIYQWGSIPRRSSNNYITTPQKLNFDLNYRVTALACGYSHSLILCDDGKVFSWGNNDVGQLGQAQNQTHHQYWGVYGSDTPYQVKGIIEGKPAIDISCGGKFSVVLLHDGKVVTWGDNKSGQLGINSTASHSAVPVEVSTLNKAEIKKIACGQTHILALSKTNILYGWGSNSCSQLGFPKSSGAAVTFATPMDLKKYFGQLRIIDIGASYACDLSVALCEGKEVLMFGKLGSGKIIAKPTDSLCESVDQVFAFYASPSVMIKPLRHILEARRRTTMVETLERQFANPDSSDLTIIVDKNEIHVHQAILKMRSDYFKTMLTRWLKKDEKIITIKKKSFIVINTYLKYLYTDKLEVDLSLAVESLLLADEYGDDNFKSLCEKSIKRDMKTDQVADIFALTRKIKACEDLNEFCLNFILNHAVEVVRSPGFKKWDADTMAVVFSEYVEKQESR